MKKTTGIRLTFCKGDACVVFLVLMLSIVIGAVFFIKVGTERGSYAAVYLEGKKIQELSLKEDREILIENVYTNKIAVKEGRASIAESDCPGRDCVHSGWIDGKGRSLVCLPNRVEIRIEGEADSEVDFIVR